MASFSSCTHSYMLCAETRNISTHLLAQKTSSRLYVGESIPFFPLYNYRSNFPFNGYVSFFSKKRKIIKVPILLHFGVICVSIINFMVQLKEISSIQKFFQSYSKSFV